MTIAVDLTELLDYSDHERRKWHDWIAANPARLALPFQAGGPSPELTASRFPTVGSLFDHTFLVERRHLSRLQGATPPDATGVRPDDWKALFEYADLVRADFRKYLADLDDATARETMTIVAQSGARTMTKRRLATHVVLHEIRHFAQIACAVRTAGDAPPGEHDLFYF